MVTRRRAFHLVGAGLFGLAGCSSRDPDDTPTPSPAPPTTTSPTETAEAPETTPLTESPASAVEVEVEDAFPAWKRTLDSRVRSPPLYADGYVVVAAGETVYGLDAASGETAWTLDYPVAPEADVIRLDARFSLHEGTVYAVLGSTDGMHGDDYTVFALRPDGTERWRYASRLARRHRIVGFADDAVVLQTSDDNVEPVGEALLAVNLDDGRERWLTETGDAYVGDVGAGVVAVIAGEVRVDCLDLETGERNFRFPEGQGVEERVYELAVGGGAVFATVNRRDAGGDSLYALDPRDGSTTWSTGGASVYELRYLDDLYVAGDSLRRVAPDGSERWRYDEGVDLRDAPADEAALYTAVGSRIVALRRRDGRERWAVEAIDEAEPRTAGAGAVLSVDRRRHVTFAHGVDDGSELWRATGPEEGGPDPALGPDGAFLATQNGSLLKVPL